MNGIYSCPNSNRKLSRQTDYLIPRPGTSFDLPAARDTVELDGQLGRKSLLFNQNRAGSPRHIDLVLGESSEGARHGNRHGHRQRRLRIADERDRVRGRRARAVDEHLALWRGTGW